MSRSSNNRRRKSARRNRSEPTRDQTRYEPRAGDEGYDLGEELEDAAASRGDRYAIGRRSIDDESFDAEVQAELDRVASHPAGDFEDDVHLDRRASRQPQPPRAQTVPESQTTRRPEQELEDEQRRLAREQRRLEQRRRAKQRTEASGFEGWSPRSNMTDERAEYWRGVNLNVARAGFHATRWFRLIDVWRAAAAIGIVGVLLTTWQLFGVYAGPTPVAAREFEAGTEPYVPPEAMIPQTVTDEIVMQPPSRENALFSRRSNAAAPYEPPPVVTRTVPQPLVPQPVPRFQASAAGARFEVRIDRLEPLRDGFDDYPIVVRSTAAELTSGQLQPTGNGIDGWEASTLRPALVSQHDRQIKPYLDREEIHVGRAEVEEWPRAKAVPAERDRAAGRLGFDVRTEWPETATPGTTTKGRLFVRNFGDSIEQAYVRVRLDPLQRLIGTDPPAAIVDGRELVWLELDWKPNEQRAFELDIVPDERRIVVHGEVETLGEVSTRTEVGDQSQSQPRELARQWTPPIDTTPVSPLPVVPAPVQQPEPAWTPDPIPMEQPANIPEQMPERQAEPLPSAGWTPGGSTEPGGWTPNDSIPNPFDAEPYEPEPYEPEPVPTEPFVPDIAALDPVTTDSAPIDVPMNKWVPNDGGLPESVDPPPAKRRIEIPDGIGAAEPPPAYEPWSPDSIDEPPQPAPLAVQDLDSIAVDTGTLDDLFEPSPSTIAQPSTSLELAMRMKPTTVIGSKHEVIFEIRNTGRVVADDVRLTVNLPFTLTHPAGTKLELPPVRIEPGKSYKTKLTASAAQLGETYLRSEVNCLNATGCEAKPRLRVVKEGEMSARVDPVVTSGCNPIR